MGLGLGGNPLAWGQLLTNTFGGLLGLTQDYPNAQRAAEETNRSQQSAIDQSHDNASHYGGEARTVANRQYWNANDANNLTLDEGKTNLTNWSNDYFKRGGMTGQVRDQMQEGGALSHLRTNNDAAQRVIGQIPDYQKEYAKQRATAYDTLSEVRQKTDWTTAEVTKNADIAGMETKNAALLDELKNVRGAAEIASAVSTDVSAKQEALADLEANKHAMDPRQYMAEKQRINDEFNGRIRDTSTKIADAKTEQYVSTATKLTEISATARANLNANLVNLNNAFGANAGNILNSITASINGEGEFINNAVKNGIAAGSAIDDLVFASMQMDEKVRATAMVDGPNALRANWNANTQRIESEYGANLVSALNMQSAWDQMGVTMEYSKSPAFASIAPYFGMIADGFQQGFDNAITTQQQAQAERNASQNQAMGWAGIGVGAANAFGPSYSPPAGQGGWSWG